MIIIDVVRNYMYQALEWCIRYTPSSAVGSSVQNHDVCAYRLLCLSAMVDRCGHNALNANCVHVAIVTFPERTRMF